MTASNFRQVAAAAYLVGFLLFFIPFFDAMMSVAPWVWGNPQWRFGAIGLLSNALMLPASGALIAVATAVGLGHFKTQRALGIVAWLLVLLVFVSAVMFALDAVQTKSQIRPEMMLSYRVSTLTATCKLVLGMIAFALLGRACRNERVRVEVSETPRLISKRDLASS
jgi:hypothetical protein